MLITGLPHEPQPESCDYVLSQDGLRPSLQGTSAPADWPKNGPVIAVLPATRLSWHRIKLPPLPKSQRLTAVIGLLEDQWLQAPGTLHISLHPIPEAEPDQDNHWVCTCDAAWLHQAMQPLIQAGRTPQRLVPEFAPVLAGQAETLDVIGPADAPLGVWCRPQGVLWTPMPCPWPLLQATPVQVRAEPALLQVASTVAKSAESIHTQTRSERWLQAVARPWDLAQGAWSQTPGQKAWRKLGSLARSWAFGAQWRRARWAGATLIASQCLGLLTWSWFMSQELAQQKQNLNQILTQSFPDTALVVDAPMQMQQALQRLRLQVGAAHAGQPEVMLSALAPTWPATAQVNALRYDGRVLEIKGIGMSDQNAQDAAKLRQSGYRVRATPEGVSISLESAP